MILRSLIVVLGFASLTFAAAGDDIQPAPPSIPEKQFRLSDFGGVGDGKQFEDDAFIKAIAAIRDAGGGRLIVPTGTYRVKHIELTSHLDFHLEPGVLIQASGNFADYGIADPNAPTTQPSQTRRVPALISCPPNTTDLAITGGGTIDGAGAIFWTWSDKYARRYPPGRAVVPRPALVQLTGVQRLHINGISVTNSPQFQLMLRGGSDYLIENVRVFAPSDAPNTDAINVGGKNIIVRNCEIDSGDDNVALQSGSHDVLVENLTCLHGHGISIGSPTRDGLHHIFVRNCTFDGTDNGLRIKSYRGNGGEVSDIHYSNITMKNVRRPFDINARYNGNANVASDVAERDFINGPAERVPNFHGITVDHLTVTKSPVTGRIVGIADLEPHAITFSDCQFDTVRGFLIEDAKEVKFERTQINSAVGAPVITINAEVTMDGSPISGSGETEPFYAGN